MASIYLAHVNFCVNIIQGHPDHPHNHLLYLLPARRQLQRHRFAPQPQRNKRHPPSDRGANARNPRPSTANDPTPRPLVVRKVTHRHGVLLLDVGIEGPLVVNLKVEDAVLVGQLEGSGVDAPAGWGFHVGEGEAVEGREHGEFELQDIVRGGLKSLVAVP